MSGRLACAIACLLVLAAGQAVAQPVPVVSDERDDIAPDRPDVTNGTHILDTGLLQIEFGAAYTRVGGPQRTFGTPTTLRLGLSDWLEARVGFDGLLWQTDGDTPVSGPGNVQLGAKLRLWGDPGGAPVLAVLPSVNLPVASVEKGLGSGSADYTLVVLTGRDLGPWHADVNYGIGAIGADEDAPRFTQHLASASFSVQATPRLSPYAEAFWWSRADANGPAVGGIDGGAIYAATPSLAFDAGVQVGIGRGAPAVAFFGGLSIVVGDVLGQYGVHARQRRARARAARRAAHG